jgi:hypothetical protein
MVARGIACNTGAGTRGGEHNRSLVQLSFQALRTCRSIDVSENRTMQHLNLDALRRCADIDVSNNRALLDASFSSLEEARGIKIKRNASMRSVTFPELVSVEQTVEVYAPHASLAAPLFPKLQRVGGNLTVFFEHDFPVDPDGTAVFVAGAAFPGIKEVGGNLRVVFMPSVNNPPTGRAVLDWVMSVSLTIGGTITVDGFVFQIQQDMVDMFGAGAPMMHGLAARTVATTARQQFADRLRLRGHTTGVRIGDPSREIHR